MVSLGIDIGGTSVKMAAVREGAVLWKGQSSGYEFASTETLIAAINEAANGRVRSMGDVASGLCAPGLLDQSRRVITMAVNVPGLVGVSLDELVMSGLKSTVQPPLICNDAVAAAVDFHVTHKTDGRLLALALGTGVGASVLDDGVPLLVEGESPGHIGQIDVSLDDRPPIGSDGGAGSLESYIGSAALKRRLRDDRSLKDLPPGDPGLRALARAIRIGHAIYRPHHVALLGGTGTRLIHCLPALRAHIERHLTSLARPQWTLQCGDHDYHSAIGAARMAATEKVGIQN